MYSEAECDECRRLLDSASTAITRQLRAIARLDLARLRRETDMIASLEAVVREASQTRAEAVSAYKTHRVWHNTPSEEAAAGQGN